MISRFFIDRPVLANVLAAIMVLLGLVAIATLPVTQYPNVVPPTVQVTTRYPGASAETVMNTVALPIEQQVNGVQDMLYMQSTSTSDGSYTLTVTFKIGTDLNFAQVLVQNRVASALASLPQSVQAQGVTVQQRSTSILLFVTLTSPGSRYDSLFLSNYATINLVDATRAPPRRRQRQRVRRWPVFHAHLARPGDAEGARPDAAGCHQRGPAQSQQVTGGQVGTPPAPADQAFQYTVNVEGRLTDPAAFGDIVVKAANGSGGQLTRVKDVARVELGAQTYSQSFRLNGEPAAGIAIFQSPNANALAVAAAVRAKMTELAHGFPQGLAWQIPFDTTRFVNASIDEVYRTLIEAGVLVLVVILVFLQDWRATLVPATTVPVTIIGAFALMAALGFTVNLSTLVRAGAVDRHRGGRRDRGGGRRHPSHGTWPLGTRRRRARHAGVVRADHRHHAGADVGVRAGCVPARPDRPDVRAVRHRDRRHRPALGDQRGDAEADAMRAVAAPASARGATQLPVPQL